MPKTEGLLTEHGQQLYWLERANSGQERTLVEFAEMLCEPENKYVHQQCLRCKRLKFLIAASFCRTCCFDSMRIT